jgi:hypothetical protein
MLTSPLFWSVVAVAALYVASRLLRRRKGADPTVRDWSGAERQENQTGIPMPKNYDPSLDLRNRTGDGGPFLGN